MKIKPKIRFISLILFAISQLLMPNESFGQKAPDLPNRTITLRNPTQTLKFGAFCVTGSGGGTVTVNWDGTRTATGSIILLNTEPFQPAIFEISLCQGRNVTFNFTPPSITMNGSPGGGTLNLEFLPEKSAGIPFPVNNDCNFITPLRVGGKLTVGSPTANPSGTYNGSFSITFTQQ